METYLKKLRNKKNLSFEESKAAFELLMSGKTSDSEIFDFLTLLSAKGEVSTIKILDDIPTCGAANPTPLALYIVSHIFSINSSKFIKSLGTSFAFFFNTGFPYATIGKIIFEVF